MSWRRLDVLIGALARTPGTLLHRELSGDEWTLDQHLLAFAVDALNGANWQRAGEKGKRRPDPVSPLARKAHQAEAGEQQIGKATLRQETILAHLRALRTGALDQMG